MNESPARERPKNTYTALDFFAGSGLVTEALSPWFNVVWANDVSVTLTVRTNNSDSKSNEP